MDFRFAPGTSWAGYIIESPLGAGRTGETYRARRGASGAMVALKICWPKLAESPDFVFAFQHQAKLLQKIQSPAVVAMLDCGINKGLPFCASEFVPGPRDEPLTLRQILSEKKAAGKYLKIEEAAGIALSLCDSLIALHSFRDETDCPGGLFAGELRPENVLIDAKNMARLVDVGFDSLARKAGAAGAADYASPGVRDGNPATAADDTCALGLIVYELLTNRKPDDPPKPPSELRKTVRTGWDVLILQRCVAMDPAKRIADAGSLKKALEKLSTAALQEAARKGTLGTKSFSKKAATIDDKVEQVAADAPAPATEKPKRKLPPLLVTAVSLAIGAIGSVIVIMNKGGQKPSAVAAVPATVAVQQPAHTPPPVAKVTSPVTTPVQPPPRATPPMQPTNRAAPPVKSGAPRQQKVEQPAVASATTTAKDNPVDGQPYTVKSMALAMQWIPPGEVKMGSGADERAYAAKYLPTSEVHALEYEIEKTIRIEKGFWLGQTEVTVAQWRKFMTSNAGFRTETKKRDIGYTISPDGSMVHIVGTSWREPVNGEKNQEVYPVVCVTPGDTETFCAWLTKQERIAGRIPTNSSYRLPTQAEWEYACRGKKSQGKFWWGDDDAASATHMNAAGTEFAGKYPATKGYAFTTQDHFVHQAPVDSLGEEGRNDFGLADMLGNVWECVSKPLISQHQYAWCGGSFADGPGFARCAANRHTFTEHPGCNAGFRVCLSRDNTP